MTAPQIETLRVGAHPTNCYLVKNPKTHELVIVDAGAEAETIIAAVEDWKPLAVLATHGHYDHIGAVDAVCGHFGIPLYVHKEDISKLADPEGNGSLLFDREMTVNTPALPLEEGQELDLAGLSFTVLHTPGHSRGSCCFLLPENQGVFCGDTLFKGGYGRTDIGDGSFAEIKQSLRRLLFDLPEQVAYPGHSASTFAGKGSLV